PMRLLAERTEPTDAPMRELVLGDTFLPHGSPAPGSSLGFRRRDPLPVQELDSSHVPSGIGIVYEIAGYVSHAVSAVEFQRRGDRGPALYGEAGLGQKAGPSVLQTWEYVIAVQQEQEEPSRDQLGNSLSFFTSAGSVVTLAGDTAHRANRFAAARGQQIRGLCFEGFQLDGINVAPVDSHSHGLISEIDGNVGSGVDRVEFVLRDGHRE
ncbi:unnamed protein product, partial [Polarella glacialis]